MSDNSSTLWFQSNINQMAIIRARQAIQESGMALPCTVIAVEGSLVTVKFEVQFTTYSPVTLEKQVNTLPQVTIPKAESQWLRAPTQIGDVGLTIPADTFLGGVSGQGAGTANLDQAYGSLTELLWIPVAAISFAAAPDPNAPWLNGPNGAVISDTARTVQSTYDKTAKTVTHIAGAGTANQVKTIYDGAGNAISHIVSSGGKIGLGALASGLASTRAVPAQADIQTLANNIVSQTLQTLATAIGTAATTAAIPNASAFLAILSASGFVTGLSGINPTIPACSSIVRVSA